MGPKDSFMLKINLRYFHELLGQSKEPPNIERLKEEESKMSLDLEKWNTSIFPYFNISLNFSKQEEITL